jgi:hypothetical protein
MGWPYFRSKCSVSARNLFKSSSNRAQIVSSRRTPEVLRGEG